MKKFVNFFIKSSVIITFIFFVAGFAYAADLKDYTVLTPLPGTTENCADGTSKPITRTTNADGTVTISGGCQTNFETYIPGMYKLFFGVAGVLAFIYISYGGFLYMTSDSINSTSEGKKYIKNAIWGLVLVIASWVILNTINPELVNFNLNITSPPTQTTTTTTTDSSGLQTVTLAALDDLKAQCSGCTINITSTTGGSHDPNSLHYQGLAVDIAPSNNLNAFVSSNSSNLTPCQTFTKSLGGKNTTFLWEEKGSTCGGSVASTGDHWHVSVAP